MVIATKPESSRPSKTNRRGLPFLSKICSSNLSGFFTHLFSTPTELTSHSFPQRLPTVGNTLIGFTDRSLQNRIVVRVLSVFPKIRYFLGLGSTRNPGTDTTLVVLLLPDLNLSCHSSGNLLSRLVVPFNSSPQTPSVQSLHRCGSLPKVSSSVGYVTMSMERYKSCRPLWNQHRSTVPQSSRNFLRSEVLCSTNTVFTPFHLFSSIRQIFS